MNARRILTISAALIVVAAVSTHLTAEGDKGKQISGHVRPAPAEIGKGGFIPPPMYLHHIRPTPAMIREMPQAPVAWDWRTSGDVTSVKDQNPYGTCWAFAAIGCIESAYHIQRGLTRDWSEYNVVSCADNQYYDWYGYNCNTGGNAWIAANYLSILGTINDNFDQYPGTCPNMTGCYDAAPWQQVKVREFRSITAGPPVTGTDNEAIKNAVMTYGPVIASMYSSWTEFNDYYSDTCLTYSGTEDPNHAVLIVGWNDTLCGGTEGAWIVKNSWGTSWGDAGYFHIKYGHANIGTYAAVISRYSHYDDREKLYYVDEYGYNWYSGWADETDWGMVVHTPEWSGLLYAVDIWTTSNPCNYRIMVYDDFSGGSLSNLLGGPYDGTVQESGFYSIELPESIGVAYNDPVYIAVRFNTPGWNGCLPNDHYGPMETDRSWASSNGSVWEAQDAGDNGIGDICIRGRVLPECDLDIPMLDIQIFDTETYTVGLNDYDRYWVEVVNRGDLPAELFEPAPDLYPYTPDNSRGRFEIQNAETWASLNDYGEVGDADELDSLYFDVVSYLPHPDSIVVGLQDRRCYITYGSNTARVPARTCGMPVLTAAGYSEEDRSSPHWEIRLGLENTGARIAYLVSGEIAGGPEWLALVDSTVTYGRICLDRITLDSGDTYTLDMSEYPGGPFTVTLEVVCEDVCGTTYYADVDFELELTSTGDDTPPAENVRLAQNYPNPFNPSTTIRYELPVACHVRLAVYDVTGRLVRTLVDERKVEGAHEAAWNGTGRGGTSAASGVYFYRIEAAGEIITRKMALLR